MDIDLETIGRIGDVLASADTVHICGHKRPDGDCLGSQLALWHTLRAQGKRPVCFVNGLLFDPYAFLPGLEEACREPGAEESADVTVFVDCSSPDRFSDGFRPTGATIRIDHHATNSWRADIDVIDSKASSTGELIYDLFEVLGWNVTPEIATCLYTAILTDTGSFRYANTGPRCLEVAGRLVGAGADPAAIATSCYESIEPSSMTLTGEVLASLRFECDGALAWSEITREMFNRAGGEEFDPDGLVSDMRAARGVEISALFKQTSSGARVSLRGRGNARVDLIAERFGGGGHHKAAGAEQVDDDYESWRDQVLAATREALSDID